MNISHIVLITVLILITLFFILFVVLKNSQSRYSKILNPTSITTKTPRQDLDKEKKKKYKKEKINLKDKIVNSFKKKGIVEKVNKLYVQAGYKNKSFEDLMMAEIKVTALGLIIGLFFSLLLGNFLFLLITPVFVVLPTVNLISERNERRNAFSKDFPYFLQTLAFVLKNGANLSNAFEQVVEKQQDSVLKQVMYDVITAEKLDGGNFKRAFSTIQTQVDTDETREFINIVEDQLDKGASISDVFQTQSDIMQERFSIKQAKLISSAGTKVLFPILLLMVAIGIFFINF